MRMSLKLSMSLTHTVPMMAGRISCWISHMALRMETQMRVPNYAPALFPMPPMMIMSQGQKV